jgi:serine/threonine-protein kinase
MGEVYRASDTRLQREVALKVLPPALAANPERLERFQREARALAALDHPGIVGVYSVEESDGIHFLTMQLVEGDPLDVRLAEGPLPLQSFLDIALPLSEALAAAHEKGIIHRDLKPANIMVTPDGRVKILDFGLARVESSGSNPSLTNTPTESRAAELTSEGQVFGTVFYMSPEQVRGARVDARSDVFSLGVVLYQMLTGERPFRGESAIDVMTAILRDTPAPVTDLRPDLPAHLGRVLRRCLEKEPRDRYQTSRDVYNELRDLQRESSAPPPASGRRSSRGAAVPGSRRPPVWAWAAGLAAALLVAGYFVARSRTARPAGPGAGAANGTIQSLAVLPLDNYSGDPSQDYFAEGMTDELTSQLANISKLRVISRGSAMQFKGKNRPPTPEIAKKLDVDAVVEGSVIRSGDKVRITAQLIDARSDRHLWAKSFERSSKDVLALQDELAAAIAREIHVTLTPAEASRFAKAQTIDPEAYDAYLKGRYWFNRPSDENLQKAIALFEETTRKDPTYAPAFSGLSDAVLWAGYNEGFLTASEAKPRARAGAEKAIALDDDLAEGHASLATYRFFYEYDWSGCEAEFRRAFALNPNYAFAHDQFGLALGYQGRFDEAIAEGKRAAELDPLSPQISIDATIALGFAGQYRAAKDLVAKAAALDPTYFFAPFQNGWIDIQAGRPGDGIPELRKAKGMESPAFAPAWLAYAYGASGDRTRAAAEGADLAKRSLRGTVTAFNQAMVALGLGERARALDLLEQAFREDSQWLTWLRNDKAFDPLRSEPRFHALLKKLNLEK